MPELGMRKKSTESIVTEISGSLSMTLEMIENSGAVLAGMMLMVSVLSNIRCRRTEWGASHLRPRGLDFPGCIFSLILN